MAKKKKGNQQTQDQIDKQERLKDLQKRLQALADTNKYEYMSEFAKAWNSKNDEKIEESIKMENRFHFHFKGGMSVLIENDKLRLG